jgi:hypothetical protein
MRQERVLTRKVPFLTFTALNSPLQRDINEERVRFQKIALLRSQGQVFLTTLKKYNSQILCGQKLFNSLVL